MKQFFLLFIFSLEFLFSDAQVRYDNGGIVTGGQIIGEYSVQGNKWDHRFVKYYFQNVTPDLSLTVAKERIRSAFNLWQNAARIYFIEVCSAADADIVIFFASGVHGDAFPFDGPNLVLAHAFFPPPNSGALAGDIHFDEAETWTNLTRSDPFQPVDLFTIALHEIGHSIGLNHTNVGGAIMEAFYTGTRSQLASDDIDGAKSIYGAKIEMINGPEYICSTGLYSLNEAIPAGFSVSYSLQPSGIATLAQTGSTATLTRTGDGLIYLSVTISTACGSITFDKPVRVGAPIVTWPDPIYPNPNCLQMGGNNLYKSTSDIPASFVWGYTVGTTTFPVTIVNPGGNSEQAIRISNTEQFNGIYVAGTNACGTGPANIRIFEYSSCGNGDFEMKVLRRTVPHQVITQMAYIVDNPVGNILTIGLSQDYLGATVIINDMNGKTLTKFVAHNLLERYSVAMLPSGIYQIRVMHPRKTLSLKFIKR
jgi:Matrixin